MRNSITAVLAIVCAILASPSQAVYFPDGIDWANPSSDRFIQSLYLNMLGRAPENRDSRDARSQLRSTDSRESRLRVFRKLSQTAEYQRLFDDSNRNWRIYKAPDYNYNEGRNSWRYQAAAFEPYGFQLVRSAGSHSQQIAKAVASHYNAYCYTGEPCVSEPRIAQIRGTATGSTAHPDLTPTVHACADPANHNSQFKWVANNGTTYPRGIDGRILCMGQDYYEAAELTLMRYQCETGYLNCRRNRAKDLQGHRSSNDGQGHPTIFFRDGSRVSLTSGPNKTDQQSSTSTQPQNRPSTKIHACADPERTTSRYQWRGPNGSSISRGIDNSVVCMSNYFYIVDGVNLQRYQCAEGFARCQRQSSRDLRADRRLRIDGAPGMQFANGTTLALIKRGTGSNNTRSNNSNLPNEPIWKPQTQQQPTRPTRAGEHDCANPARRVSQFRWIKKNGTSSWPDGIDGRIVCLTDAYYVIEGGTLRHFQCNSGFRNCRANTRKDLIALQDGEDKGGYRTLVFANGDALSLISR